MAQTRPALPPPALAVGASGLAGGFRPDADSLRPVRYGGPCVGVSRSWTKPVEGSPTLTTTLTLGGRLALATNQPASGGAYTGWGINVFGASEGPWFGAALGVWAGRLGRYREAGRGPARAVPQLRVRGGELGGWHGQLDFAQETGSVATPVARALLGHGWAGGRGLLRLGVGTSGAQGSLGAAGAVQVGGPRWRVQAEGLYGGQDFFAGSLGVEIGL